jgi:hypothetical protein
MRYRQVQRHQRAWHDTKKTLIPPKRLTRKSVELDLEKNQTFKSGYVDGNPLYSAIRVLPLDIVSEIAIQEKAFLVQQDCAATLFE